MTGLNVHAKPSDISKKKFTVSSYTRLRMAVKYNCTSAQYASSLHGTSKLKSHFSQEHTNSGNNPENLKDKQVTNTRPSLPTTSAKLSANQTNYAKPHRLSTPGNSTKKRSNNLIIE